MNQSKDDADSADDHNGHASSQPNEAKAKRRWHKRMWNDFIHQHLPGRRALFRLRFCVCFFLALCIIFLAGGGILLSFSLAQVQIRVTYSGAPPLDTFSNAERSRLMQGQNVSNQSLPVVSDINILVEHDMDQPIYMYYILHNYHQNHKRYVRSVSWNQVHGMNLSSSDLDDCKGQKRFLTGDSNSSFVQNGLINPCGLISWSFFNDTFGDFKVGRQEETVLLETISVDSSKLAWDTDRRDLFGNVEPLNHNILPPLRGGQELMLNISKDEHFMVWMRLAAHSDVRKYYGVIRTDLKKGDRLQFSVTHQYNTYDFDGEKELLFTTSGPFGNRNLTFGVLWLAMGGVTGCITIAYIVLGWHQIWSVDRRVADLQRMWAKGSAQYHVADTYLDESPLGKGY